MKVSTKVSTLNFFRNIFRIRPLESVLVRLTAGRSPQHFFCKFAPNPYQYSPGTWRTVIRNGINIRVDVSDFIGHTLFFGFRDQSLDMAFSICKPDYRIIDVGANVGWTALNFARLAKEGSVVAFEPDPVNFSRCCENLGRNAFDNVKVLSLGLGDRNYRALMELRTPSNRGGNRVTASHGDSAFSVEIRKLDDVWRETNLDRVDLMKIDVEGFELNTLRGGEKTLRKHRPILFVELDDNNLRDQGGSSAELVLYLLSLGYTRIYEAVTGTVIKPDTDFTGCHWDIIAR